MLPHFTFYSVGIFYVHHWADHDTTDMIGGVWVLLLFLLYSIARVLLNGDRSIMGRCLVPHGVFCFAFHKLKEGL